MKKLKNNQLSKSNIIAKVRELVDHLTEKELMIANKLIVDKLKFLQKSKSLQAMSNFCIGDTVYFEKDYEMVTGIITKLNQKTVSIETEDGIGWNVAPSFLKRFVDVN